MVALTPQIILTLAIIGASVLLFVTETLRVDVIALLVLLTVTVTGLIGPDEAFMGFANPAVVTVWAVYIVSGALFRTGVADILGERIQDLAGDGESRLVTVIMLVCGTMSAFMNNIGATAVLLPAVAGISRQVKIPLSRLLIPLSFASLLGGNMTAIGTPPNILVTSILAERGLPTFAFFDFTPMGLIVFAVGILYMVIFGRKLLPVRETVEIGPEDYELRDYISEVRVSENSPLAGQSLVKSRLGADYDLNVITVVRDSLPQTVPQRETVLEAGDLLVVEGNLEDLIQAEKRLGLVIEAERRLGLDELEGEDMTVVEATLAPRSPIVDQNLRSVQFRERYGFTALAIRRHDEVITQRMRDVQLAFGDTLLLKGPRHRLAGLKVGTEFLVLEPVELEVRRSDKAPLAVGILALVLALTTLGNLHISLAMVTGSVLVVLTGCLTMDEAYQSIEWRSIFLIAGMLPLGTAMEATGTAQFLADQIVGLVGGLGPLAVLAGIYVLSALITQPMSNAAATVLVAPIAIDTALGLGADPRAFALAVVIGASTSFLTPVGHQSNVLVFGPGGYRFLDFTRVGLPLNVVILLATLVTLPLIWPLFP